MGYAKSPFLDFESYLRTLVGRDEDGVQLKLKQSNSDFVTYEKPISIYSIKDILRLSTPWETTVVSHKMNLMILA